MLSDRSQTQKSTCSTIPFIGCSRTGKTITMETAIRTVAAFLGWSKEHFWKAREGTFWSDEMFYLDRVVGTCICQNFSTNNLKCRAFHWM